MGVAGGLQGLRTGTLGEQGRVRYKGFKNLEVEGGQLLEDTAFQVRTQSTLPVVLKCCLEKGPARSLFWSPGKESRVGILGGVLGKHSTTEL